VTGTKIELLNSLETTSSDCSFNKRMEHQITQTLKKHRILILVYY
jgi:hypothetical protein